MIWPSKSQPAGDDLRHYEDQRNRMVETQIERRGVTNPRVLKAMRTVPRHVFVPLAERISAYEDYPLPIGEGQTISQPYIVAYMTELLEPQATDRVLEIGTGSGYQAAVLAECVKEVCTIELIPRLAERAQKTLAELGYQNISFKTGDGYLGWPEKAPFDGIMVTAAAKEIPPALISQLKTGGRLVIPVEGAPFYQTLQKLTKNADGTLTLEDELPVSFVPLVHPKK